MKNNINFYTKDEISKMFKNGEPKEKLVYIDDGISATVGRYKDVPDIIVDLNQQVGSVDLTIYDYDEGFLNPLLSTYGMFLNKCKPKVREEFIKRLLDLQTGQKSVKKYKLIDIYELDKVLNRTLVIRDDEKIGGAFDER